MQLDVGCTLNYRCAQPATLLLTIRPHDGDGQRVIEESFQSDPPLNQEAFVDSFGNRTVRLLAPEGLLRISYRASVVLTPFVYDAQSLPRQCEPSELPPPIIPFVFPSRYCQSDRLVRLAGHITAATEPGYARVEAICDWVHDNVEYCYGTSDAHTSAADTVSERVGVCRDFAHLGIALCRAAGIPARFVAGYALKLDPPDFHAYFEAYLDGQWYLFDATRKVPREGLVRIATGRDAADTSFANLFGAVQPEQMSVWCQQVAAPTPADFVGDGQPVPARID
ncbi:transglutaminase domain-containing protein [Gloeobacter kilaueensis]|uniref:Transglutaminase domain-containing protein n=1 Tax=Gloeobacter kilaueensis (strain ATCC BAA-2537 / CCAP 1431/1 / ULC 316 / JS1) TaxID=1183438 RepID=U5QF90_GLOK1|nr:transglutaminase family protein [Gloeobacter kilaueensis]AGY56315.1 transglutaminase domain-containing protein [Gloeobacter kilaueensis JS1]